MDPPETRYAKSGNVQVAYCIRGDGPVDLVYIPGWVSNIELMWEDRWMRAWLDRLATFSRLIAFDKRGTGLSDRVTDDRFPDRETRMDDVRAVMDAAGSQHAFLRGHSEGGPLAALFATAGGRHERSSSANSTLSSTAGRRNHCKIVDGRTRSLTGQRRGPPHLGGQVLSAEREPERRDRHQAYVVRDRCPTHCAIP